MTNQRRQNQIKQLNDYVTRTLEAGLWATLYEDLATCYKVLNLTVPKRFKLEAHYKKDTVELSRLINDSRIQVKQNERLEKDKLEITAVWN